MDYYGAAGQEPAPFGGYPSEEIPPGPSGGWDQGGAPGNYYDGESEA